MTSTTILRAISYAGWLGLLALQLNLIGCSVDEHGFIAHDMPESRVELIRAAADTWCLASDGARCPHVGTGDSDIYLTPENGAYYGLHRTCPDGRSDIYLVDNLEDSHFYSTAVHEFGHHFGCQDYWEGHDGIMTVPVAVFEVGDASIITASDLACATK